MAVVYDLWDIETGNMIGTYPSEAEAMQIVRELLDLNGVDYAEALGLGYLDEHGNPHPIATGATLVDRVREVRSTTVSTPHALAKQH